MKVYNFKDYFNFILTRKILVFYVLLIFKISICFGQKNKPYKQIDSLIKMSKKYDVDKLKLLISAYNLSEENKYVRGKVASCAFIGDYYLNTKKYDSANYYLEKAHLIIQEKQKFKRFLKKVLRNKARIFAKKGFYTKALFLYRKAYKVAINNKMKDTFLLKLNIFNMFNELGKHEIVIKRLIKLENKFIKGAKKNESIVYKYYLTLAKSYEKKKDFPEALRVLNKNIQIIKKPKYKELFNYSLLKISKLYVLSDSLSKAQMILEKFSNQSKSSINKTNQSFFYEIYGKLSYRLKDYSKSNKYYDSLIDLSSTEPITIVKAYQCKFDNYHKLSMHKEANESIRLYMEVNDSLQNVKDKDIISYYNSDLRYVKERKQKNVLKVKNKKQKNNIIILSLVLICLSFLITIVMVYIKYSKSKVRIKKLEINEKNIFEDQLKKREEELIVTASSIKEQNRKIKLIKKKLNETIQNNKYDDLLEIREQLNNLLSSSTGINLIYDKLESRYPNLAIVLKKNYPQLTANDIKHCLLLKLNLSIKDCSQLLNVSDHAIKMARKRIKKKMKLSEEIRLKEFLSNI